MREKNISKENLLRVAWNVSTWAITNNHKHGIDKNLNFTPDWNYDRIRIESAFPSFSEDALDRIIELSNINLKYIRSNHRVIRLGMNSICATTVGQLKLLEKNTGKTGNALLSIKVGDMKNEDIKQYLEVPDWW